MAASASKSNDMPRRRFRRKAARALARIQNTEPKQASGVQVLDNRFDENYRPDSAEALAGRERYIVELHTFATRPLDSDNTFAKVLIDQLRYHGLIPEDNPYEARVVVYQYRVRKKTEEGTKMIIKKLF